MEVANPIYDAVFKYLMEDDCVARTILSALLKKDVLNVEMRPHEYSNTKKEPVSMFRIDFSANVRQADGTQQLTLIEIQKSWMPSEVLRFRQYLGVQYESERNMTAEGYGLQMVAVYLLGHLVGDIVEPVLYVHHEPRDYDGNVVTRGLPDPCILGNFVLVYGHIVVERIVETVEWDYPQYHLIMHCYLCHVESGHLELKEHEAARWLNIDELESVGWLPADRELIKALRK